MSTQSTTPTSSKVLRIKTLATRVTTAEMRAVEEAANSSAISRSEWLRDAALAYLEQPRVAPHPSAESTTLQEVMALQYLVLNLFARANPGFTLLTLHEVMAIADKAKHGAVARVLTRPSEESIPE